MRPTPLLSASLVAASLAVAALTAASTPDPTLSGTIQVIDGEPRPGHSVAEEQVFVVDKSGRRTKIALPAGSTVSSGVHVQVRGRRSGSDFVASSVKVRGSALQADKKVAEGGSVTTSVSQSASLATAPATRQRVLVILATWTTPDGITPATAQQIFFNDADRWYTQASYGAMGLTGDVTPWQQITGPDNGACWANMDQIMSQAKSAALASGFDSTGYDRTVVYFPQTAPGADCSSYAGWAERPGANVWLNGNLTLREVVHEQGHNLGLGHAHALACTDATGAFASLSDSCSVRDYGDDSDAMGSSNYVGAFQAAEKLSLGWLSTSRIAEVGLGSDFLLAPANSLSGAPAARMAIAGHNYWLEHHTQSGPDAALPAGLTGGLVMHISDVDRQGLLDLTPDNSMANAELAPNTTWVSDQGFSVSVGQDTGAGLPVSIRAASVPGAPQNVADKLKGGRMVVSWSAPASTGGANIVAYVITYGGQSVRVSPATSSWTSPDLLPGTYTPTVAAVNGVGVGASSQGPTLQR